MTDAGRGVALMVCTTIIFAAQDGISKHLAEHYPPIFVVMLRYWFFAAFVMLMAVRGPGGLRAAISTSRPALQIARGALLAFQIVVMITGFALLGLIDSHSVFAVYALMVAALAGPILGERIGWRRWIAIGVGLVGVLIILRPGLGVFDPLALIPLLGAAMMAAYQIMTRIVSRIDSARTSFFYTGIGGALGVSLIGPFFWSPMVGWDWAWMGLLCLTGMSGHYLLIKALEAAEASLIQPFSYLQLVFASILGVSLFGETIDGPTVFGAALIVGAALFTIWRERVNRHAKPAGFT